MNIISCVTKISLVRSVACVSKHGAHKFFPLGKCPFSLSGFCLYCKTMHLHKPVVQPNDLCVLHRTIVYSFLVRSMNYFKKTTYKPRAVAYKLFKKSTYKLEMKHKEDPL